MKCPVCEKGNLVAKKINYSVEGRNLGDYDGEACTNCNEQFFTEESSRSIEKKAMQLEVWGPAGHSEISSTGTDLIIKIPSDLAKYARIKRGEKVTIHSLGKRRFIIRR